MGSSGTQNESQMDPKGSSRNLHELSSKLPGPPRSTFGVPEGSKIASIGFSNHARESRMIA